MWRERQISNFIVGHAKKPMAHDSSCNVQSWCFSVKTSTDGLHHHVDVLALWHQISISRSLCESSVCCRSDVVNRWQCRFSVLLIHSGVKWGQLPPTISKLDPEIIANSLRNFSTTGSVHRLSDDFITIFFSNDFLTAYIKMYTAVSKIPRMWQIMLLSWSQPGPILCAGHISP